MQAAGGNANRVAVRAVAGRTRAPRPRPRPRPRPAGWAGVGAPTPARARVPHQRWRPASQHRPQRARGATGWEWGLGGAQQQRRPRATISPSPNQVVPWWTTRGRTPAGTGRLVVGAQEGPPCGARAPRAPFPRADRATAARPHHVSPPARCLMPGLRVPASPCAAVRRPGGGDGHGHSANAYAQRVAPARTWGGGSQRPCGRQDT